MPAPKKENIERLVSRPGASMWHCFHQTWRSYAVSLKLAGRSKCRCRQARHVEHGPKAPCSKSSAIEQRLQLHPARVWCYGRESFMSIAVHIGGSCFRGTPSYKVPGKILQKFRFVFHLLLKGYLSLNKQVSAEED